MRMPARSATFAAVALAAAMSAVLGADGAPQRDGRAAFEYHCGKCHAEGGTGTFMLAKRFGEERALLQNRKELTVEFIRRTTRFGSLSMPRITRVEVPDAELDAIARYLISGQK